MELLDNILDGVFVVVIAAILFISVRILRNLEKYKSHDEFKQKY
jgi:hypothetical protein